jgi:hypothetical protein
MAFIVMAFFPQSRHLQAIVEERRRFQDTRHQQGAGFWPETPPTRILEQSIAALDATFRSRRPKESLPD